MTQANLVRYRMQRSGIHPPDRCYRCRRLLGGQWHRVNIVPHHRWPGGAPSFDVCARCRDVIAVMCGECDRNSAS